VKFILSRTEWVGIGTSKGWLVKTAAAGMLEKTAADIRGRTKLAAEVLDAIRGDDSVARRTLSAIPLADVARKIIPSRYEEDWFLAKNEAGSLVPIVDPEEVKTVLAKALMDTLDEKANDMNVQNLIANLKAGRFYMVVGAERTPTKTYAIPLVGGVRLTYYPEFTGNLHKAGISVIPKRRAKTVDREKEREGERGPQPIAMRHVMVGGEQDVINNITEAVNAAGVIAGNMTVEFHLQQTQTGERKSTAPGRTWDVRDWWTEKLVLKPDSKVSPAKVLELLPFFTEITTEDKATREGRSRVLLTRRAEIDSVMGSLNLSNDYISGQQRAKELNHDPSRTTDILRMDLSAFAEKILGGILLNRTYIAKIQEFFGSTREDAEEYVRKAFMSGVAGKFVDEE